MVLNEEEIPHHFNYVCFSILFINVFVLFTVKHIQFACGLNVLSK